jgi:cell division protein FtsQ
MTRKTLSKSRRRKTKKGTRKSTILNKRRKGVLSKIIPWMKRFGLYTACLIFIVWIGAWIWLSGSLTHASIWLKNKTINQTAAIGFTIQNIMVDGRVYSEKTQILEHSNIKPGDPLFAFSPAAAQEKIEKLSWIKTVKIERRLPNTIYMRIKEHYPIALYSKNGTVSIVSESGALIPQKDVRAFTALPLIHGENALAQTPSLIDLLEATPEIKDLVKGARWVSNRRWDLILRNDTIVRLPEKDPGHALVRLSDSHAQNNIIHDAVQSIDLRNPARISIRPKPGMAKQLDAVKNKNSPAI